MTTVRSAGRGRPRHEVQRESFVKWTLSAPDQPPSKSQPIAMFLRTKDTRAPLALDGAEAQRVRALIEAGHGRPKILDTLRSEGFDVSERQIRTLYDHLRSERRETRAAVQEQVVERAVAALAPGVTDDLKCLLDVRDAMMLGLADCAKAKDWQTAAACASRATAAARARLELAGVTPAATAPVLSEDDAAKILAEEFGDTGALKRDDAAAELH